MTGMIPTISASPRSFNDDVSLPWNGSFFSIWVEITITPPSVYRYRVTRDISVLIFSRERERCSAQLRRETVIKGQLAWNAPTIFRRLSVLLIRRRGYSVATTSRKLGVGDSRSRVDRVKGPS